MAVSIPPYRLKIERAKRHIRELTEETEAFHSREPYAIFTEDEVSAGQRHWKVHIKERVPAEWSGIVGGAIHNARAALDLLLVAVVRHDDPGRASYNHVHFTVRETRDKFKARLPENMQGASAKARRLVEHLRPYKGGNEAFWRLHQLDILDKHKAIIPVGSAYTRFGYTLDMAGLFPDQAWMQSVKPVTISMHPADRMFPLEDGATLLTAGIDPPFQNEVQFKFEIAFGEGQILDGEPVVPALLQICDFVERVCGIFERHILSK